MNHSLKFYGISDQSKESTVGNSPNITDFNSTSNFRDITEDNTPPPSPLPKMESNSFFASFENNNIPSMDTSDHSYQQGLNSTSSNLTTVCPSTSETFSSFNTPPDTPTFQSFASHPLSISSVIQSMSSCFPTPPDTPTSPFMPTLKHSPTHKRTITGLEDSFIASPVSKPLQLSAIQTKEKSLCQNSRVLLVPQEPDQNEKKKKDVKKTRPKLKLNTRLRSHNTPLPKLVLMFPELQEEEEQQEGEQETEIGRQHREKLGNVKEIMPGAEETNRRETTVLFFIGSDLRRIADQFHATYDEVGRILQDGTLTLTISTAITGCLSVTIFWHIGGETLPQIT